MVEKLLVYIFFIVYRRGDVNFAIPNDGKSPRFGVNDNETVRKQH